MMGENGRLRKTRRHSRGTLRVILQAPLTMIMRQGAQFL